MLSRDKGLLWVAHNDGGQKVRITPAVVWGEMLNVVRMI